MFFAGHVLLLLGITVGIWFPINKSIWTSSFSIFSSGWALICLAMFYWIIDVQGRRKWARPFVIYGMNSIAVYVLAGFVERILKAIRIPPGVEEDVSLRRYIFKHFFQSIADPPTASLLFGLAFALALFGVAWGMWKKRWFIRI
jgi:predicted acyltransferase